MEMEDRGYVELRPLHSSSSDINGAVVFGTTGKARQRPQSRQIGIRALLWTIFSATAVYTTKRLMVNHNYPATIAFRIYGVTLVVYAIALFLGSDSTHPNVGGLSKWRLRRPKWLQLLPNQTWKGMIPASAMAAMSVPMLFQGLLHMPSLAVLAMLFPIVPAAESFILCIHSSCQSPQQQCQEARSVWWAVATMSTSSVVLYNEYRLMVPGLIWGVSGLLFIGVVHALLAIESRKEHRSEARLQSFHGFIIMTLFAGLVVSSAVAYLFEVPAGLHLPYPTIQLIFINTVSLLATVFTGSSLALYSPISLQDTELAYSSSLGSEIFPSFASSILLLIATMSSAPATVVSLVQIAMFLLATFCIVRTDDTHSAVTGATVLAQRMLRIFHRKSSIGEPHKTVSISIVIFLFVCLGVLLSILESSFLASLPPPSPTSLDTTYNPPSTFDIVVSTYLEEPSSIKSMLESIKKTAYLSSLKPNVILYTKDPQANLEALLHSTGADVANLLENVGREGGTYLQHIVANWEVLAEKTMFIQAHAHNMRELLPRINDYLVADTGMLSLGFTGVSCSCGNCQDRWGWKDDDKVIPTLYAEIYNQTCNPDTPITLSYKGQFVASARRIRGIDKSIYKKLLLAITTREGWNYNGGTGGYEESLDDPFFGFTMERIWGLIMQCATDGRVASHCPSLLSGKGIGGDVRDCQCLDTR